MKKLILKLINNSVIRYIFFGGLTTLVNFVSFYILTELLCWNINISNVISVALSILFAYFVNSRFVFQSEAKTAKSRFYEFCKFVGARLFTMAVEVGGVWLMADILKMNGMVAKLITQVVVLVSNYVISKVIVFVKKSENAADPCDVQQDADISETAAVEEVAQNEE